MPNPSLDRRTLIRTAGAVGVGVAGVGALAACGSSSDTSAASSSTTSGSSGSSSTSDSSGSSSTSGSASSSAPAASGGLTVATADIPVGGGKIITDSLVVVTQPVAGTFKAFSATCPHQGCPVTKIVDGKIDCPCHGSQFDITTGAPTADSPAKQPLEAKTATVSGADVVIS